MQNADPHYYERRGLYIGQGKAMLSRPGIFRVLEGVAVDMCNRVFKLPSFHSMFNCSWETLVAFILQTCSNFGFLIFLVIQVLHYTPHGIYAACRYFMAPCLSHRVILI